jgi:dihydrodipicolinate synthase/N-acetylneuraminate lyase
LLAGGVIPACPLALTAPGRFDERHQRALFRYYRAAGAAGLAVGVHTTQFAIHEEAVGLYRPLLELAAEVLEEGGGALLKVAGLVGRTEQAVREGRLAADLGYDLGLLSLGAFREADDEEILAHCRAVAEAIPLMGFYLQPAVGGRVLGYSFWRRFLEIPAVRAVKIAPFNRYYTLDVLRALADTGRADEVATTITSCWTSSASSASAPSPARRRCASPAASWGTGRCGRGAPWSSWRAAGPRGRRARPPRTC